MTGPANSPPEPLPSYKAARLKADPDVKVGVSTEK